jgi:hypothetical protein
MLQVTECAQAIVKASNANIGRQIDSQLISINKPTK